MKMNIMGVIFLCLTLGSGFTPSTTYAAHPLQNDIEEAMICLCGCGQTIKSCPHQNCGYAIPARARIDKYLNEGKNKAEILDIFVDQYGEEALATPKKEGFNLLGYIMPFAVLAFAGALIMIIIRKWTNKGLRDEEDTLVMSKKDFGSDIDKQIEKELEEMD
ncbi:MAG: cytochrome c-type biogenesis protein CcmH [bacterium]|nr:cytochrome c-type biogenesis protein CcmH [bacterium]